MITDNLVKQMLYRTFKNIAYVLGLTSFLSCHLYLSLAVTLGWISIGHTLI